MDDKKDPVAVIRLTEEGIKVDLTNWLGVGATMVSRMTLALEKAHQQFRADKLTAARREEQAKEIKDAAA